MRKPWPAVCLYAILVPALALHLTACSSYRARREFERAISLERQGRMEEMVVLLRNIEQRYPGTEAARRAARMRPLYEGLLTARARFPVRRAVDILRQVAGEVERHRELSGTLPRALAELVPSELPAIPDDPWGRELRYECRGDHYRLSSLGSDGEPGGSGEAMDLFIQDGLLTPGPSWAER